MTDDLIRIELVGLKNGGVEIYVNGILQTDTEDSDCGFQIALITDGKPCSVTATTETELERNGD